MDKFKAKIEGDWIGITLPSGELLGYTIYTNSSGEVDVDAQAPVTFGGDVDQDLEREAREFALAEARKPR